MSARSTRVPFERASVAARRTFIGHLPIDAVDFSGALAAVEQLVASKNGGSVFTPNVDHIVQAETDERFRRAYQSVSLSLADGMPVLWASWLLGLGIPQKVSGADIVEPLMDLAAKRSWRVYFLGGAPGAAEGAAKVLRARLPSLQIVGWDAPRIDISRLDRHPPGRDPVVEQVVRARPDLVMVALGAPKQELWITQHFEALRPAVLVAVGASLDFIAGTLRRAPPWMSRVGLEWLYRLGQEPRRLARRYLLRDPQFAFIVARALIDRRGHRSDPPRSSAE